jgi:hypothetical protein
MHEKDNNCFADELLDAALARHRSADPRPGLEGRVLAHLRAEPRPAPWFRWGWLPALASVAALMLAVGAFYAARRGVVPERVSPMVARTAEQPPVAAPPAPAELSVPPRQPRPAVPRLEQPQPVQVAVVVASPRRPQFPTPAPLSEQEKLLLRYVSETPKEILLATLTKRRSLEELRLEELQIPALVMEDLPAATEGQGE